MKSRFIYQIIYTIISYYHYSSCAFVHVCLAIYITHNCISIIWFALFFSRSEKWADLVRSLETINILSWRLMIRHMKNAFNVYSYHYTPPSSRNYFVGRFFFSHKRKHWHLKKYRNIWKVIIRNDHIITIVEILLELQKNQIIQRIFEKSIGYAVLI